MPKKNELGQFYTKNAEYILDGFSVPKKILEPFAGKGDLINWAKLHGAEKVDAYDIDPKYAGCIAQDTLSRPPKYAGEFVLTNPPYLAKNKTKNKALFDKYNCNDLYKIFISTLCQDPPNGGIIIIPAGFFMSPRKKDTELRDKFMTTFAIKKIKIFEEAIFADTTICVVCVEFYKSAAQKRQSIPWLFMPSGIEKTFEHSQNVGWVVGGEIFSQAAGPAISRHVKGVPLNGEQQLNIMLNALDSGKQGGEIKLTYEDAIYEGKPTSRTYASLRVSGCREITVEEQKKVCAEFNQYLSTMRSEYCSLFLPHFREYSRKRIPFDLAYAIVSRIVGEVIAQTK
jgi:hypothetical protein